MDVSPVVIQPWRTSSSIRRDFSRFFGSSASADFSRAHQRHRRHGQSADARPYFERRYAMTSAASCGVIRNGGIGLRSCVPSRLIAPWVNKRIASSSV